MSKWLGLAAQLEASSPAVDDASTIVSAVDDHKPTEVPWMEPSFWSRPARTASASRPSSNTTGSIGRGRPAVPGSGLQISHGGQWFATANLYAVKSIFAGHEELDGASISDQRWDVQYQSWLGLETEDGCRFGRA